MPLPSLSYASRSSTTAYDPTSLSDDEGDYLVDDVSSLTSSSTGPSSSSISSSGVVLGFPDGLVPILEENRDWKMSRIGGEPTFPHFNPSRSTSPPNPSSTRCKQCGTSMPLLLQIYCPLENSNYERIIYLFGCGKLSCRKDKVGDSNGSVRAFRAGIRWVDPNTEKKKKKKEKKKEAKLKKKREEDEKGVVVQTTDVDSPEFDLGSLVFGGASASMSSSSTLTSNPFAFTSSGQSVASSSSNNPFGNPFAAPAPKSTKSLLTTELINHNPVSSPSSSPIPSTTPPTRASPISEGEDEADEEEEQVPDACIWSGHPSLPTYYLNTSYEPDSPSTTSTSKSKKVPPSLEAQFSSQLQIKESCDETSDQEDEADFSHRKEGKGSGGRIKKGAVDHKRKSLTKGSGGAAGDGEVYEVQKIKGVDQVFLNFQERVSREPEQVIRYEFSGQPIPFSAKSTPYSTLFKTLDTNGIGIYSKNSLPKCSNCNRSMVFEYQIMPNLVNLLNKHIVSNLVSSETAPLTVKSRKGKGKDLDAKLQKEDDEIIGGFDWSSIWVFTCSQECLDEPEEAGQVWREEKVFIEWEEDI